MSSEDGLYSKYDVRKDGEQVENCFVLEPEDDRAARAAIKAYAQATDNDALAEDLLGVFEIERTPQEEWEKHNESFSYDPPELPGDAWSSEQYQELHDRVIGKRTEWVCEECSKPFRRLDKARSHVESKHGRKLIEKHETPRDELETATDGGTETSETEQRESENHGLGDFS